VRNSRARKNVREGGGREREGYKGESRATDMGKKTKKKGKTFKSQVVP